MLVTMAGKTVFDILEPRKMFYLILWKYEYIFPFLFTTNDLSITEKQKNHEL